MPSVIARICQRPRRSGAVDRNGFRQLQDTWEIHATGPAINQEEIFKEIEGGGTGIPWIGTAFVGPEGDSSCIRVTSVRLDMGDVRPGRAYVWTCTVEYSNSGDRKPVADPNPLNRVADVKFDDAPFRRAVEADSAGAIIRNSAGDPIPRERDDAHGLIRIRQNRPGPGQSTPWNWKTERDTYRFTTNASTFTILGVSFEAGKCRLNSVTAALKYENCIYFWEADYVIEYRTDGWKDVFFDTGFAEYYPLLGRRQIVDVAAVPTPYGYYLNGAGLRLAPMAAPVPLEFTYYPAVSWSGLTFNQTLP